MNTKHLISKKDLLIMTGISYGQLYRWKRQRLIPEEWFIKQSAYTGQETFFPREQILSRIQSILELKDKYSLDELAGLLSPKAPGIEFLYRELKSFSEIDGKMVEALPVNRKYTYPELAFLVGLSSLPLPAEEQVCLAKKGLQCMGTQEAKTCVVFSSGEKNCLAFLDSVENLVFDRDVRVIGTFSLEEKAARLKMNHEKNKKNL